MKKDTKLKWEVFKSTWPFEIGYGTCTINLETGRRVILDQGLPKERAIEICKNKD